MLFSQLALAPKFRHAANMFVRSSDIKASSAHLQCISQSREHATDYKQVQMSAYRCFATRFDSVA